MYNVYLCFYNILFKLKWWNTIHKHTTCFFIFLKNCWLITFFCKIECTWKSCRSTSNYSNFFIKAALCWWHNFLRYITCIRLKILHSYEFLNFIYSNSLIYSSSCTRIFTSSVTYMSTYCRKRIFFLDKRKCIHKPALCSHLKIALDCYMCWTGCFTRCCTCIITVNPVLIPVVLRPHMWSPFLFWWKRHLRILYFFSCFST